MEFIYGYVPAVLAGFILTALPRWTGEALAPPPPLRVLAALWLAGRVGAIVALVGGIEWPLWISSLFPIVLAVLIGRYLVAARNWRNAIVAILLALFALGAAVDGMSTVGGGTLISPNASASPPCWASSWCSADASPWP